MMLLCYLLLPLFEQDQEGTLHLDPLSPALAGERDLLGCLHPRERASLGLKAAASQVASTQMPQVPRLKSPMWPLGQR